MRLVIGLLFLWTHTVFAWTYREVENRTDVIERVEDSATVPANPANRDYVEFLKWQKEGNRIKPPVQVPVDPRMAIKLRAHADVKDQSKPATDRLEALLILLDFDR